MISLTFIYMRIFFAARKNSRSVRKQSVAAPMSSINLEEHYSANELDNNEDEVFNQNANTDDEVGISLDLSPKRKNAKKLDHLDDELTLNPGDAPKALIVSPPNSPTKSQSSSKSSSAKSSPTKRSAISPPPLPNFIKRPLRAPKLSALKARGYFSKPVLQMTSFDACSNTITSYGSRGAGSR